MAENADAKQSSRESHQDKENNKLRDFLTEEEVKSDFFMELTVTLQSAEAKRIFRRTFDHIQTQMTAATVLTRKFGLRELSDENASKIKDSIKQLSTEMNNDMMGADRIFDAEGIKSTAITNDAVDLSVKITCPEGMQFMNLLRQLDLLAMKLKTLWMMGEIQTAHSEDRIHAWQVRIFKVADAIRALGHQAYAESERKRSTDQKKAQAKRQAFQQRQRGNRKAAAAG